MVGLAAILNQVGWLARTIQILGGLYLIYLGVSAWETSSKSPKKNQNTGSDSDHGFRSGMRIGLLVNLSNPKAIAFFVSLYAAIVPADAHWTTRALILGGGALMELAWYKIVGRTLSRRVFKVLYRAWASWIERVLGTVLIVFGGRLVLNR